MSGAVTYTTAGGAVTVTGCAGGPAGCLETLRVPSTIDVNGVDTPVVSIGSNTFAFAKRITTITVPSSVQTISSSAFFEAAVLSSVTLSNGLTSIGTSAFFNATSLATITVPKTVTKIGFNAFGTQLTPVIARTLTRVYYRGDAPAIYATGKGIYGGASAAVVSYRFAGTSGWPAAGEL